jgi:hypothetical protein
MVRHRAQLSGRRQVSVGRLKTACELLSRVGIVLLEVRYDGSEGSGRLKGITAYDVAGLASPVRDDALVEMIEDGVEALLPDGWTAGEGSFGRLSIGTRTRGAFLSHVDRLEGAWDSDFDL